MKHVLKEHSTLAVIVVATLLGAFVWIAGLVLVWLLLRSVGIHTDIWAMVSALSSALTTGTVLAAAFIAFRELKELSDTRHLEVLDRLFDELNSDANTEARRQIYVDLPAFSEENAVGLPPSLQAAMKHVLNSLDRVAFLTQSGWVPEKDVMPWMNPMVVKVWNKMRPYIRHERARRNEPDHFEHAERLADRCGEWRLKHLPGAEPAPNWLSDNSN